MWLYRETFVLFLYTLLYVHEGNNKWWTIQYTLPLTNFTKVGLLDCLCVWITPDKLIWGWGYLQLQRQWRLIRHLEKSVPVFLHILSVSFGSHTASHCCQHLSLQRESHSKTHARRVAELFLLFYACSFISHFAWDSVSWLRYVWRLHLCKLNGQYYIRD